MCGHSIEYVTQPQAQLTMILIQCNRRYPCNHCTQRRRPEECAYYPSQVTHAPSPPRQTDDHENQDTRSGHHQREQSAGHESLASSTGLHTKGSSMDNQGASLAESFGYFEDSECNTMALFRRVSVFWKSSIRRCQWTWLLLLNARAEGVDRQLYLFHFIFIFFVFRL